MDNAADAVKESADAVIGSNLEAGVGKEIMRILAEET